MGIGFTELLIIFSVILLFFGGKKLPELGKGMGEAIKNFKSGMNETSPDDVKKDV